MMLPNLKSAICSRSFPVANFMHVHHSVYLLSLWSFLSSLDYVRKFRYFWSFVVFSVNFASIYRKCCFSILCLFTFGYVFDIKFFRTRCTWDEWIDLCGHLFLNLVVLCHDWKAKTCFSIIIHLCRHLMFTIESF